MNPDPQQSVRYTKTGWPNLPYLYGNASVSFFLDNVLTAHDNFSVNYNFPLCKLVFYLYWPSRGNRNGKHEVAYPTIT
ncbi:MAG: hypothetical protein KL787_03025 [Taibaiella sp.]|nr:hypothetical protein [Taibaiella sp.]